MVIMKILTQVAEPTKAALEERALSLDFHSDVSEWQILRGEVPRFVDLGNVGTLGMVLAVAFA